MLGFDDHWTEAVRQIDAVFGEDFSLEPYAVPTVNGRPDVNGRAVPDTTRPVSDFRATFRDVGSEQHAKGRTMAENVTRPIAADGAHLRLTVPGEDFARPRINDRIVRVKTGERFRVTRVLPRGRNSMQVSLSAMATAP